MKIVCFQAVSRVLCSNETTVLHKEGNVFFFKIAVLIAILNN